MDTDDRSSDHEDKTENNLKLIKEISLRPALFNYQLPIEQRTKKIREVSWLECAKELQTTVYDCQKRWKNLRDTYHLYRQHHQNLLERWRYTKSLSFLQNIHTVKARKKTTNGENSLKNVQDQHDNPLDDYYLEDKSEVHMNVKFEDPSFETYDVTGNLSDIEEKTERPSLFKRKRTKRSSLKRVVYNENDESIRDFDPIMLQTELNESAVDREKDEIDLFLDFINKKMRKLPLNDINEIQRKFLDIVVEKEENLAQN